MTEGDLDMKPVVLATALSLLSSQVFAMDSLSDLTWKSRVVLVFGSSDSRMAEQQVDALEKQTSELADRDMVVIRVSNNEARSVYGKLPSQLDAMVLKKEAEVTGDGFHIVLIGKDGGVKLRSERVVGDVEMFDLIDRMPMRKAGQG
jgi:hypothetical protein